MRRDLFTFVISRLKKTSEATCFGEKPQIVELSWQEAPNWVFDNPIGWQCISRHGQHPWFRTSSRNGLASAKMSMQRTLDVIQSERRYSEPCMLWDCSLILIDVKYHQLSLSRPSWEKNSRRALPCSAGLATLADFVLIFGGPDYFVQCCSSTIGFEPR